MEESLGQIDLATAIKELEAARDAAIAESKAKSEFLVNMSHEIRTPLTGVLATASLLLEFEQNQRNRNYIELIEDSGRTLLKILDDIFDISRLEVGCFELQPTPVNPLAVIASVLSEYRELAADLGLFFRVEARDVPTPMFIDGARLRQVLSNLVDNGLKFTEHGGVVISCAMSPAGQGKNRLSICVSDTGVGIAANRLSSIFQAFAKTDSSTHRLSAGSGLGLAISRRITELMGGELIVESELGIGSTFTISLTALSAVPVDQQAKVPQGGHKQRLKVLLAEDNEVNTLIATEMLQRLTCRVTHAANGLEAIAEAEKNDFDLILLDIYMPECSGIEACEAMRASSRHSHTTIGALTASVATDEIRNCLEAGMDFVVGKPFSYSQLRDTLIKWFPED